MWPFAAKPVVATIGPDNPPVPPPPVVRREERKPRTIRPFVPPSPEQLLQEDIMNHPLTRFLLSGVMGGGMGALFGLVMGGTDPITTEAAEAMKKTPWKSQVGARAREGECAGCCLMRGAGEGRRRRALPCAPALRGRV